MCEDRLPFLTAGRHTGGYHRENDGSKKLGEHGTGGRQTDRLGAGRCNQLSKKSKVIHIQATEERSYRMDRDSDTSGTLPSPTRAVCQKSNRRPDNAATFDPYHRRARIDVAQSTTTPLTTETQRAWLMPVPKRRRKRAWSRCCPGSAMK